MAQKVLIVDDDPAMLRLLEKYLVDSGHEVLKASGGREAVQVMLAEAPPILITDWMMPEMDGLELCRALRDHEGVRFVYIMVVSAHTEINRIVEAFAAGADDFLSKPVSKHELLARLRAGERIAKLESDVAKHTREVHRLNAEMAMANDRLQRMATTDELTGLLNRREAMSRLRGQWETEERYNHCFSCIMLDIDHFKKFNDTHGHAAGDAVLRDAAVVLRASVRTTDVVCRIGGEEFLVICPNVESEGAAVCAEHLRAAIESHDFVYGDNHLKVTISLGVARRGPQVSSPDELLKLADDALYASKLAGRNCVTVAGEAATASTP